jgi:hypothetical protein
MGESLGESEERMHFMPSSLGQGQGERKAKTA